MAVSAAAVGLIGAGLGAAGAVLAQVVAQVASERRDSRRFVWEREQAALAKSEAQSSKFSERRLGLFVDLLQLVRQTENAMRDGKDIRGEPRRRFDEWRTSVAPTLAEAQILAPSVYLKALGVDSALVGVFYVLEQLQSGEVAYSDRVDDILTLATRELRSEMRAALGIEGDEWLLLERGEINENSD